MHFVDILIRACGQSAQTALEHRQNIVRGNVLSVFIKAVD